MMELSREAIFESRVQWGALPDWKGLAAKKTGSGDKSGDRKEHTKVHPKKDGAASGEYKGPYVLNNVFGLCINAFFVKYFTKWCNSRFTQFVPPSM